MLEPSWWFGLYLIELEVLQVALRDGELDGVLSARQNPEMVGCALVLVVRNIGRRKFPGESYWWC